MNAEVTYRLHASLAVIWLLMTIPTWYLWRTNLFWIAFISLYANFVSHWGAYQAVLAQLVAGEAATEAKRVTDLMVTQELLADHARDEILRRIEKSVAKATEDVVTKVINGNGGDQQR